MASIIPIPTTRVSDGLVRQRLLSQLTGDQLALVRLQSQISTGRRFSAPSEDPEASQRAIGLQRLLERKAQVAENVAASQTYLTATDSALSNATDLLRSIQSDVLGVLGDASSPQQRAAVAAQVRTTAKQLVDLANRTFRGRYLFGGSKTDIPPYRIQNNVVSFEGNQQSLQAYSDLDQLHVSNRTGPAVFGGVSPGVEGNVALNPIVTSETLLSDLNGGRGVAQGSITISDGAVSRTVDLNTAVTVGDVIDLVQGDQLSAPLVRARVTPNGISLESKATASLTVFEVGNGRTATDLGILKTNPIGATRVGDDLDPLVTLTTSLADVLGVRAQSIVAPTGVNNDLIFEATQRGTSLNDVAITFVDGGAGVLGAETAVYDDSNPLAKTLTITVASGLSTANQVIAAVAASGAPFSARLDTTEYGNNGNGAITATASDASAAGLSSGGSGSELDQTSGLRVTNGGQTFDIDISGAHTVEDLLNTLNGSGAGLLASISGDGAGLEVRSRWSGDSFSIGENGGTTATQLGIRSLSHLTRLDDLNQGRGVQVVAGNDLLIRRPDGTQYGVDLSGAETIDDVLAAISADPLSQVTARLSSVGNGIELVAGAATGQLAVIPTGGSRAAYDLGLVADGAESSASPTTSGGNEIVTGADPNLQEASGAFQALLRLAAALESDDDADIERNMTLLDQALDQVVFQRSDVGAEQQGLDALKTRLDDEDTELRKVLSDETEVDLESVITELAARQTAYEATLRTIAQVYQLSLLNFL